MSVLSFLVANKLAIAIGGLSTVTVAAVVPMTLSSDSEQLDVKRDDDVLPQVPAPASEERPRLVKRSAPSLPKSAKPALEVADDSNTWVEDSVYNAAVNRASGLSQKASDYKSRISGVIRYLPQLRQWSDKLAQCRAKNDSVQFKMYDFSGLYNSRIAAKEDYDSLDLIIKSISGGGDLWNKQKAVEGNRDLNRFKEFESGLNELEESYSAITQRKSADNLAYRLSSAVSTLGKNLDVCDWKDVIRLNNLIGEQYRSSN